MISSKACRIRLALAGLVFLVAGIAAATVWYFFPAPKHTAYVVFHIRAKPVFITQPEGDDAIDFDLYRRRQVAVVKSRLVLYAALSQPEVAQLPLVRHQRDPLKWLEGELKVDLEAEPELMKVSLKGDNPEELKAILDAVTSAYLKDVLNKDMSLRRARYNILEKHYRRYLMRLRLRPTRRVWASGQ